MIFRANEAAANGFEEVKSYFITERIDKAEKPRSLEKLQEITESYGPVVTDYPTWHPFLRHHNSKKSATVPNFTNGYEGLDHTRFFVNAILTCPYGDGADVINSIEKLSSYEFAHIQVQRLDVQLYARHSTPLLITCEWSRPLQEKNMIPASLAIPLMLTLEVPAWEGSECPESWEAMYKFFVGAPHGKRSSHFVNQETVLLMKKIWNLLNQSKMYEPHSLVSI